MIDRSSEPLGIVRYDAVAIALHWLVAAAVLAELALGWWMLDLPKTPPGLRAGWFNVHKSLGIAVGVVVLLRLAWRLSHPPPPLPRSVGPARARAARAAHASFYALLLAMTLAGYLGSVFSGYPILFFGTTMPAWGWKDAGLKDAFSAIHYGTVLALAALLALHTLAALKHWAANDGVFDRMLPNRMRGGPRARSPASLSNRESTSP